MSTPWRTEKKGPHAFKLATSVHPRSPRTCSECPLPEANQIHTTDTTTDEPADATKARYERDDDKETGA